MYHTCKIVDSLATGYRLRGPKKRRKTPSKNDAKRQKKNDQKGWKTDWKSKEKMTQIVILRV